IGVRQAQLEVIGKPPLQRKRKAVVKAVSAALKSFHARKTAHRSRRAVLRTGMPQKRSGAQTGKVHRNGLRRKQVNVASAGKVLTANVQISDAQRRVPRQFVFDAQ